MANFHYGNLITRREALFCLHQNSFLINFFHETNFRSKFVKQDKQYADVAVASICSNVDYDNAKALVWTLSIYLNMVCRQFDNESFEIIANYSTLPIGMFTMRESPHDPNKYEKKKKPFVDFLPPNLDY